MNKNILIGLLINKFNVIFSGMGEVSFFKFIFLNEMFVLVKVKSGRIINEYYGVKMCFKW